MTGVKSHYMAREPQPSDKVHKAKSTMHQHQKKRNWIGLKKIFKFIKKIIPGGKRKSKDGSIVLKKNNTQLHSPKRNIAIYNNINDNTNEKSNSSQKTSVTVQSYLDHCDNDHDHDDNNDQAMMYYDEIEVDNIYEEEIEVDTYEEEIEVDDTYEEEIEVDDTVCGTLDTVECGTAESLQSSYYNGYHHQEDLFVDRTSFLTQNHLSFLTQNHFFNNDHDNDDDMDNEVIDIDDYIDVDNYMASSVDETIFGSVLSSLNPFYYLKNNQTSSSDEGYATNDNNNQTSSDDGYNDNDGYYQHDDNEISIEVPLLPSYNIPNNNNNNNDIINRSLDATTLLAGFDDIDDARQKLLENYDNIDYYAAARQKLLNEEIHNYNQELIARQKLEDDVDIYNQELLWKKENNLGQLSISSLGTTVMLPTIIEQEQYEYTDYSDNDDISISNIYSSYIPSDNSTIVSGESSSIHYKGIIFNRISI